MKGQANIVMMILVLFMVAAVFIFLLQLLQKPPQSELDNLYVHNMLLSIMRTDTGYEEEYCRTVSDAVSCAFVEPYLKCGGQIDCKTVAERRIGDLINKYSESKQNRIFYIEVTPVGKVVSYGGKAVEIYAGIKEAEDSMNKAAANEKLQKLFRGELYTINARLVMAERE